MTLPSGLLRRTLALIGPTAALLIALTASASQPEDLLQTLDQLEHNRPVRVQLLSALWRAEGKGDDREEVEVSVNTVINRGTDGTSVTYGWPLLDRLEAEANRLLEDPDARTPTTDFMWRLDLNEVRPLLNAAAPLRREIQRSSFRTLVTDRWQGQPARRLIFDRDKTVLDERARKYVKQFHSTLEVWVDEAGMPLASRLNLHAKGSLLFVIRGEYREESTQHYQVLDGHLIVRERQRWRKTDIPGEHHETQLTQTLQPL
ncbi:hypothetical protein [Marinimicrobium sp. LS-A18]|uniref:hypothetical protein n=1 Tax=Marinimicrobium sp. LS-A18 TaxID=1381596 RepID=UPI000466D912|nr:hypothetical protein [Marinimicrobium sp. LS-A18]